MKRADQLVVGDVIKNITRPWFVIKKIKRHSNSLTVNNQLTFWDADRVETKTCQKTDN